MSAAPLVEDYDTALFDLDGVVYLGPDPVPGAADGIAALRAGGTHVGFVTNNAARTPAAVAEHLRQLGIPCQDRDVVTSAQAAVHLMVDRFPERGRVLVVGTTALVDEVRRAGFDVTTSAEDHPVAVIQGYDPEMTWSVLTEAAIATQHGAAWVVTNTDTTRPTDRGLVPGNGAAVAVVQTVSPIRPHVAGKPHRPLMEETIRRLGASRAIFVGDRIDTDIAGAVACGMDSMLVLSGAHGLADLVGADASSRPTHLGRDLRDLLQPARRADVDHDRASCNDATAVLSRGDLRVEGGGLDAAWALAALAWSVADRGEHAEAEEAVAALSR